ncbi:MAG TPA: hypothetical protein VFP41_13165 [Actinomycetota bacterium]|nr:hypothetical protein [Actinomycetota bacterium]
MSDLVLHLEGGSSLSTPAPVDEFLRRERDPLFAALFLIVGDRGEAEALARDAFATVWERWDRVGSSGHPVGFLRHVALRSFRRRSRRRAVARRIGRTRAGPETTPDDRFARLTPLHRAALVLTELWRYDAAEAGRALGVPASAIGGLALEGRTALMQGQPTARSVRTELERELAAVVPATLDVRSIEQVRQHRRRREAVASLALAIALVGGVAAARSPSEDARVPVDAVHRSAPVPLQRILVPRSATPLGTHFRSTVHGVATLLGDVPAATGLARRASSVRFLEPAASPLREAFLEAWAVEYDSPIAAQAAMSVLALSLHFDWGLVDSLPAGLPGADDGLRFVDRSIPRSVVYLWRREQLVLRLVAGGNLPPSDVRPLALAMDGRAVGAIR